MVTNDLILLHIVVNFPTAQAPRDARNESMPKIMSDPRLDQTTIPMPFDGKRMIYGGFEVVVDA